MLPCLNCKTFSSSFAVKTEAGEDPRPRLISAVKNKIAFVKFDQISLKKYSIMVHIRNSNIREPRSGEPNQVVVANGPIKMTQDVRFFQTILHDKLLCSWLL